MTDTGPLGCDFLISRRSDCDEYGLWQVDWESETLLKSIPLAAGVKIDRTHQIVPIGRYLFEWGPVTLQEYEPCFPYRLFEFDPASQDPLAGKVVRRGLWPKKKFWSYRIDFGNPQGANESFDTGEMLMLLPMGGFMLNVIPTTGRGTFQLWNFDPNLLSNGDWDPLPAAYTPQGSFDTVDVRHELIPLGNYVLDRLPDSGEYWLWSFDPQADNPLVQPAVQHGQWPHIDASHKLTSLGEYIFDYVAATGQYWIWRFDPKSADPLVGPVRQGRLPQGFDANTTLTGIQSLQPIDPARSDVPGTIDFMRTRIKHVVYLMLENRSFDHVCGWLYEKQEKNINFVGRSGPFDGASLNMFNLDPGSASPSDQRKDPEKVFLNKYKDGKLSEEWSLDFLTDDPYHDKSDVMRQYFYGQQHGYAERAKPEMGGFVWNNGVHTVMATYTPEQLPVLNGLARGFAISDAWFSSMPSATDPNRAFAFTGSALGQLNNFQNGAQYTYWPYNSHRPSIWKMLWTNGFKDWKIYNSIEWMNFVHTYHLFLEGQIPSVDDAIEKATRQSGIASQILSSGGQIGTEPFIDNIGQFKKDARAGKLPRFSFIEPVWIGGAGTTSYHPGADPVLGERALNELYEALKAGPAWNETLFIITFDEHGGLFDHVPPPYAEKPWPNDVNDGFQYDMMGVRVPTILISPLIEERTVFRSPGPVDYDSTSILATLLNWYGVPKARWCLGDRTHHAPTFEGVFQRKVPRETAPSLVPPYDKDFPRSGEDRPRARVSDLDHLMVPRIVAALGQGKLSPLEMSSVSNEILHQSMDTTSIQSKLIGLAKRLA
jgi:phospholipase C